MLAIFLITICIGMVSGFRGPHHPKSSISHHHYSPEGNVKLTQDAELLQDATHLKEDMGPIADQMDFSKMTDQEIEFYYFKVHDEDNNTKLDGLELLHALQHTFHENSLADSESQGEEMMYLEQMDDLPRIIKLIDRVLEEDDSDNDGYLGYIEYVLGRQKDHKAQAKRNSKQRVGQ